MSKNKKVVLILEKSSIPVEVLDKNNYRYTGNAAVFGRENENHRVYEESEYFPHLKYLQEKIKKRKLVGELDHPERFDTSLQKISHIVEKLWYDKETRTLKCNIKLLDTDPHGLNARRLADAGFPLSLSSRAAGVVGEDKKVKIKRIFAYDLVADGGFGDDAEMRKVNESLTNFSLDNYKKSNLKMLNEELGVDSDSLEIYDVTEQYPELLTEDADFSILDDKNDKNKKISEIYKNKTIMNQSVSTEEMYKYSLVVKEKIEEMTSEILELKKQLKVLEDSKVSDKNDPLNSKSTEELAGVTNNSTNGTNTELDEPNDEVLEKIKKLEESNKKLDEKLEKLIAYSEKTAQHSNNVVDYAETLAEHIQANREFSENISEILNDSINYSENLSDILNKSINYSEKTSEMVNYIGNHSDELVEQLNNVINYSNALGERLNEVINYADYLGERQNLSINYTENIAENSVIKEDFENFISYTEEMFEAKEEVKEVKEEEKGKEKEEKEKEIKENYQNLGDRIEAVLEKIKKPKKEMSIEEKYPFVKNFNETEVERFNSLNEAQKTKVEQLVKEDLEILEILETVENPDLKFITEMPEMYKNAWEKLNEKEKDVIFKRAQIYKLDTDYQIRNFWRNQNLTKFETSLNENKQVNTESKKENLSTKKLGYSNSFIQQIGSSLDRF